MDSAALAGSSLQSSQASQITGYADEMNAKFYCSSSKFEQLNNIPKSYGRSLRSLYVHLAEEI